MAKHELLFDTWFTTSDNVKYCFIKKSNSGFMKTINWFLKPFNKAFMTSYITTIGHTIYTPESHDYMSEHTFQHELEHVRQWDKWNILFSLSYLLCLPTVVTLRAYWEFQAWKKSIEYSYKEYPEHIESMREKLISNMCSSDYLWMFPFKSYVSKWFDKQVEINRCSQTDSNCYGLATKGF